jgi:large conductance mechanosensitive channel
MGLIKEFKAFAVKGNVMDMAVGIIIGGAFGKIVSSFVSDIVMPPIGILLGGVDFKDLKWVLTDAKAAVMEGETVVSAAVTEVSLNYGAFINTVIDFIIIAFAIFMMIKAMNAAKKKEKESPAPVEPPKPSNEEVLLTEIRDLLKNK